MEGVLKTVLTENRVGEQELPPDKLQKYKSEIDQVVDQRREYMSMEAGIKRIDVLRSGYGIEYANPALRKTPIGKVVYKLCGGAGAAGSQEVIEAADVFGRQYVMSLMNTLKLISDDGFVIAKKYEDRLGQKEEETVEEARKIYQDKVNRENGADPQGRVEFPTFPVNGQSFCTYGAKGFMALLQGRDVTVAGDAGKETLRLMRELEGLLRKQTILSRHYGDASGMKRVIYISYCDRYKKAMRSIVTQLAGHLAGQVAGIERYSDPNADPER